MSAPNRNIYYAQTFVDALAETGLTAVCIAPGSRSTPLTLAFAAHDHISVYSHLDERSAGFFALGMAMARNQPVALVCTSGTAAANFYPAIIEANMAQVPLLVLTADRPHELRHSGANQTIDQIKMYGDHVLWSVDMALPESNAPAVAVRNLRVTAARAYATADGQMQFRRKGVVHLNFPFRKPLEPTLVEDDIIPDAKFSAIAIHGLSEAYVPAAGDPIVRDLTEIFEQHERGLLIVGPDKLQTMDWRDIRLFAAAYQYPLIAEPLSGGARTLGLSNNWSLLTAYDTYLPVLDDSYHPDVVVRFGRAPTSKAVNDFLNRAEPTVYVGVAGDGVWSDDSHRLTHMLTARPLDIAPRNGHVIRDGDWLKRWLGVDGEARRTLDRELGAHYCDLAIVRRFVDLLPSDAILFVGNSNVVRHLEFVSPEFMQTRIYGSRGASGIDGQVSTALGIGAATSSHVYAILGDITFYHDMNGLLAIQRCGVTATILVINNNGGGIFERLPIRGFEPYHTEHFLTPHGLTFEHTARLYGLEYAFADDFASLDAVLDQYVEADVSSIIEVQTNIKTDEARRKAIIKLVQERFLSQG